MQHWYVNFDVTASGGQSGVRWMEFTTPQSVVHPTALTIQQQSTFAPDTNWRWMGSLARDMNNDVLLGYSESSLTMYPSIFIAGRTPGDTLGTLEGELLVKAGTGSQPDTCNRWGDYSAMRIDPADGCTFWYTTEFYMVTKHFRLEHADRFGEILRLSSFVGCGAICSAEPTVSRGGYAVAGR